MPKLSARRLLAALLLLIVTAPSPAMVALAPASAAGAVVLYDDSLGTLPEAQGALAYFDDGFLFGGSSTRTVRPGVGSAYVTDGTLRGGWTNVP
ncbi:MAG: hypothetical protein RLW62_06935, partial [Gammaproteobacteria bacterium]